MRDDTTGLPAFDQTWEDTIEQDHHALRGTLECLERTTDLHLLLPILEELRASLEEHFVREESPDGLHDIIASMSPNTVASLQNVLGEHNDFLTRLDALLERTRRCLRGPVAGILREATELSASLRDHETRETRLFTDAVFTDLGRSS